MATDLSSVHHTISQAFKLPQSAAEWDRYRLTPDQVAFFHANGYLAPIDVLTPDQIEMLRSELAEFFAPDHDGNDLWYEYHANESGDPENVLFHALGAWRLRPGMHDILWHPAITVPASQLLEGAVRFWHDQLFCKPARHGGVVAWHQDYSYWTRTKPMAHLTCWIGLDDSTRENGCLHYVPGSHKWELLPITGLANNMEAVQTVLSPDQKAEFKPVAVELKAGQASMHHCLTMHGSYENRSERPRRAVVVNYFRDGTHSDSNEVLLAGVPPVSKGQKMTGRFFPLVYPPNGQ